MDFKPLSVALPDDSGNCGDKSDNGEIACLAGIEAAGPIGEQHLRGCR